MQSTVFTFKFAAARLTTKDRASIKQLGHVRVPIDDLVVEKLEKGFTGLTNTLSSVARNSLYQNSSMSPFKRYTRSLT